MKDEGRIISFSQRDDPSSVFIAEYAARNGVELSAHRAAMPRLLSKKEKRFAGKGISKNYFFGKIGVDRFEVLLYNYHRCESNR